MAHNLNIENGKASLFYVGEAPWHKLGTPLKNPATSTEAIKLANMDWKVKKVPLFAIEGETKVESDRQGIVREDKWGKEDCKILGIVSNSYTPIQNSEAFEFFDRIVGKGKAVYHTAGVLGNGEKIWILAKLPGDIEVTNNDVVNKFLLLANGHDGTLSVQIKFTPVRVICQNTLNMALTGSEKSVRIFHNKNARTKLNEAVELLGIIQTRYDDIELMFKKFVKKQMRSEDVNNYLESIFPTPVKVRNESDERKDRIFKEMRAGCAEYYEIGRGNELIGVRGTLWAAYNGVTEFIDHHKKLPGKNERLNYIWFGAGSKIKEDAYFQATKRLN